MCERLGVKIMVPESYCESGIWKYINFIKMELQLLNLQNLIICQRIASER